MWGDVRGSPTIFRNIAVLPSARRQGIKWSLRWGIGKGLVRYIGPDSLRSRMFVVGELRATTHRCGSISVCCIVWDVGMPEIRDDAGRGRTVLRVVRSVVRR